MKSEKKDKLRDLFQEIKIVEPTQGLEFRIMQQVNKIAEKDKQEKKENLFMLFFIPISLFIATIISIVILIIFAPTYFVEFSKLRVEILQNIRDFNPNFISIIVVAFILLLGDLFLRKITLPKKKEEG